ncbi:MAG: hypothetical protein EBT13_03175 [Rhodobacteraceae bacterium]|nr:hypothetical protein [Paracoccaceae bacterium]
MGDGFGDPLGMSLEQDRVDEIVVKIGVALFDGTSGVHQIDPVPQQRQQPLPSRCHQPSDCGHQPAGSRPRWQAARDQPVLGNHSDKEPAKQADATSDEERAPGDATMICRCGFQPLCQIPL